MQIKFLKNYIYLFGVLFFLAPTISQAREDEFIFSQEYDPLSSEKSQEYDPLSSEKSQEYEPLSSDKMVKGICESFLKEKSKKNLNLKKGSFLKESMGDKGCHYLGRSLKKNASITAVCLDFNEKITQKGIKKLKRALYQNTSLTILSLDGIQRTEEDDRELKTQLELNESLASLWGESQRHWTRPVFEIFEKILVKGWQPVKDISPLLFNVRDEGAKIISIGLRHEPSSLNVLSLLCSDIGEKGAELLARALGSNKTLKNMNLSFNLLGDKGTRWLARALLKNNTLKYLNLSFNGITDQGVRFLGKALSKNKTLKTLSLDFNFLRGEGGRWLAKALLKNQTLELLSLGQHNEKHALKRVEATWKTFKWNSLTEPFNSIGDEGAQWIARSLAHNTGLKELYLRGNNITSEGIHTLTRGISKNKTLEVVGLQDNKISTLGVVDLRRILPSNSHLRFLYLNNMRINNKDLKYLSAALKKRDCSNLCRLTLQDNHITVKGIQYLVAALENTTLNLRLLNLNNNPLGDEAIIALTGAFEKKENLKKLCLSGTLMTSLGAEAMGILLKKSNRLHRVWLSRNFLGPRGSEILVEALLSSEEEPSLKRLFLSKNDIKNAGARALAKLLRSNNNLLCLYLKGNDLNKNDIQPLIEAVKDNISLETLELSQNKITRKEMKNFKEVCGKIVFESKSKKDKKFPIREKMWN